MSRRYGISLIWTLLMVCGVWLVASRVAVHSELGDLLPEGTTTTQRLLLTQVRSGVTGRLLLLAIEGGNLDDLTQASKQFGERLSASGHFAYVANGAQVLPPQERNILFQSRYLLSRQIGPNSFSPESLRRGLEQRLDDLRSPLAPMVKETIPEDPTGEFMTILSAWAGAEGPIKYRGVWVSKDQSKALLLAETIAAGFDADAQAAIQQDIRSMFASVVRPSAPLRLLMSGPGVFAVEIKETIEAEAWWLSLVAATLVLLFLYASYRSFQLVLLSLIPISSGIIAGILAVQSWFGYIHGITLGFGITLLGVVDDYPIHLFSHLTARSSASAVMEAIWPTMRLGVLTTTIGFASLLLAGFPGLTQLGLFAVAGLLTAAMVTRYVLPVFVPKDFLPRDVGRRFNAPLQRLRGVKLVIAIAVVLACAALLWSHTPLWETDLASVSPVSDAKKQLDQQLRHELRAPDVRDLLVIEGQTEEDVLQYGEAVMSKLEQVQTTGAIGGYDLITNYLPSRRTQQQRQMSLPEHELLKHNLEHALKGLPFTRGLFRPFLDAIEVARTQPLVERKTFEGTALGLKMGSLLFQQSSGWTAVVPLRGVTDRKRLNEIVNGWNMPTVAYVDLKEESNRLMTGYRDRTIVIVLSGLLAITVVLVIGLKSVEGLWPILLPIFSALVVVAAVVNMSGESLSLFHIATFLLVIGLGLDYALFFNRPEGDEEAQARTLYGLLVCSTTTILVFGVLASSTIPVLHAIGMTAAIGSFCCLLFAGIMAKKERHAV
jgi:predicted exporter